MKPSEGQLDDKVSPVSRLSVESRKFVLSQIPDYDAPDKTDVDRIRALFNVVRNDFYLYCEQNLRIQTKTNEIIPFYLNKPQRKLAEMVFERLAAGQPVRIIVLKARQMGFSTLIEALCYWWTATHRYIKSVIIAHEKKSSTAIYQMFKRFFTYSAEFYRPTTRYNTKHDLTFDIDDAAKKEQIAQRGWHEGLESSIETLVADDGAGRGSTINFFHGSEVALWERGEDIVSGAMQAIPLLPNTFAFLESTANGVGGYFYNEWQAAKRGESSFTPLFVAWHEMDDYELNVPVTGELDEEEQELLEMFEQLGYPQAVHMPKIAWRRAKKREFRTNPEKFYQEYPKDDVEAFVATGRPVFDIKALMKLEARAEDKQREVRFAEIRTVNTNGKASYYFDFIPKTITGHNPTPLKVFEEPQKGTKYTIGVDVAEGITREAGQKDGDYSIVDVQRNTEVGVKTVARWRGHIDPDMLGDIVYQLGVLYNFALVGVEVNNHGLTTVQSLRNKFYHNLYRRETSEDELFQTSTSKMGWLTTRRNKNSVLIDTLNQALREHHIDDIDLDFIRECMTYVRDDQGRANAQEGSFDDTVMAKAINLQMSTYNGYNQEYATQNIVKPTKKRKETHGIDHRNGKKERSALRKRRKVVRR